MSATAAPQGLRPVYHPSGLVRASAYTINSTYNTAIFKGSPVTLNTNGTVVIGAANADVLGAFAGVQYVDATGRPTYSPNWPANMVGTDIVAWVYDDPDIVFEIQANGSVVQAAVGDQTDFVNPGAGTAATGQSTAAANATLAGAGNQGQMRIVGFNLAPDNTPGDAFTIVQVKLARSQYVANKVAV